MEDKKNVDSEIMLSLKGKGRYVNPHTDFGFKLLFGTVANKEAEGERNKALTIVRNLKQAGVDINVIAASSGLSVDEIEKL